MKILVLTSSLLPGGSTTLIKNLLKYFSAENKVLLVNLRYDENNELKEYINNLGIDYISLNRKNKFNIKFIFKLRKIIHSFNPEIIHSHLSSTFYAHLCTNKVQIFHTIHSDPSKDLRKIHRFLLSSSIKKGKIKLIACSPEIKEKAISIYKVDIYLCLNGIEIDTLPAACSKTIDFLFVGRFSEEKNVFFMLDSFEKLHLIYPNTKFCLCGYGPLKNDVIEYVSSNEMNDYVELVLDKTDLKQYYIKSKCFCLFSKREGAPIVLLEAMQYGLPIVCTDIPGNKSFVCEGKNALLFELNSMPDAIKCLSKVLCDEKLSFELSQNNLIDIKKYNIVCTARKYLSIFNGEYDG